VELLTGPSANGFGSGDVTLRPGKTLWPHAWPSAEKLDKLVAALPAPRSAAHGEAPPTDQGSDPRFAQRPPGGAVVLEAGAAEGAGAVGGKVLIRGGGGTAGSGNVELATAATETTYEDLKCARTWAQAVALPSQGPQGAVELGGAPSGNISLRTGATVGGRPGSIGLATGQARDGPGGLVEILAGKSFASEARVSQLVALAASQLEAAAAGANSAQPSHNGNGAADAGKAFAVRRLAFAAAQAGGGGGVRVAAGDSDFGRGGDVTIDAGKGHAAKKVL
jgi:hypothetical protein